MKAEFADYICAECELFTWQWINAVRQNPKVPSADGLTRNQLADHLPKLIQDLAERLRNNGIAIEEKTGRDARAHGHYRWKQGYNLEELLREIGIIHEMMMHDVFDEYCGKHPEFTEAERKQVRVILHDFFTVLASDSVSQYVAEQGKVIQSFGNELQEKNRVLEEVNNARIRLIATVAHEIRNGLNALSLATAVLGEEIEQIERNEMKAICDRNLEDMSALLVQLLNYSKLVAGKESVNLQRLPLHSIFEEIVASWKSGAEEKGLVFKSRFDPALGEAEVDRLKLRQIARNLISNAIKYSKRGSMGGVVTFDMESGDDGYWKMIVSDTGIGIAQDDMTQLFNEFTRIKPNEEVSGSGLGLAITKRVVELLNGKIEAFSELGQGSRFEVTFPITNE